MAKREPRVERNKSWIFFYNVYAPIHGEVNVKTGELTPTEAGQGLKDTITEMRGIMGHFRKYPRVEEPTWLSDAVKQRMAVDTED